MGVFEALSNDLKKIYSSIHIHIN